MTIIIWYACCTAYTLMAGVLLRRNFLSIMMQCKLRRTYSCRRWTYVRYNFVVIRIGLQRINIYTGPTDSSVLCRNRAAQRMPFPVLLVMLHAYLCWPTHVFFLSIAIEPNLMSLRLHRNNLHLFTSKKYPTRQWPYTCIFNYHNSSENAKTIGLLLHAYVVL